MYFLNTFKKKVKSIMVLLHEAVSQNSIQEVQRLIDSGIDVNEETLNFEGTALHIAAYQGYERIARVLILNGANIEAQCFRLETPLLKAAFNNNLKIVEFLVQKGANVKGALHFAASKQIAEIFFKQESDLEDKRDSIRRTPLHNTVADGFSDTVQFLIEKGAKIDARDEMGYTPLYLAVEFDQISILEILIKHGADINARTKTTETALHKAAMFDNEEAIEVLVQHGANIDKKDKYWGTPLYVAACFNSISAVKMLLRNGSSLKIRGKFGYTPLEIALVENEHDFDILKMIMFK